MKAFFDHARSRVFRKPLSQGQVDGLNAIVNATIGLPIAHRAYILATVAHETAWTMQPIREFGRGQGRKYGKPGKNGGQVPYGRGYVQLTWDENYAKADKALDLGGALLADYDLALEPSVAADILVRGMEEGWFTGKKLSDYLPGDYVQARRVVNGTDRANEIAALAREFEDALRLADAPQDAPVVVVAPDLPPEPVPAVVVAPAPAPDTAVVVAPVPPGTDPVDVPAIIRQALKWSPIAKLRAAGISGIATTIGSGGLALFLTEYGFTEVGITEAVIWTGLGSGLTWIAGYLKRAEPLDQLKGEIKQ